MAYIVNRFNGTELTVVDDGVLDTTTSLGLVGRNYVGYGETQNENYVFLLENFAGNQPPARALSGQLWYDVSNKTIRVYNGTTWNAVGNAQVQELPPEPSQGGLWLKTATNQLFVSDGAVWRLVGPEAIEGFDVTKLTSTVLRDQIGLTARPVITVSIDGEIIAIYSNTEFTIAGEDAVLGFSTLQKGLTYKTGFVVSGNLKGNADTATKFLNSRRINTVSFDGTEDITIKSSTTNKLTPGNYFLGVEWDGTFEDTWSVDATPQNRIGKVVARDSNGDFSAGIVTADFIGNITGNVTALSGTSLFSDISFGGTLRGSTFTGNSATATRLQNPPTINTVLFDGTESIILPVPANTLTTDTLAPNVVNSSLINLGKLEFLEIEAPGLKVGDGNDLSIFIEGFTPTIRSDVTDIIKLQLFTGSALRTTSDISFIAARTAQTDTGTLNPALVPDWNKSVLSNQKIVLGTPNYRWRNVFSEEFTGDTLNILQVNSTGAEVQFNDPLKAAAGLIGDLSGNVIGNLIGNVTGNVAGAASLNMLKSGDTMTGDLSWTSTSRGLTWSFDTDGASIKFYSVGEGDPDTRLEFNTSNNGTEYFLWTHTYEAGNTVNLMRLDANDNFGNIRLQLYGNIEATGKIQANNFVGDGSQVTNIASTNITTGRISNARLTGSYDIDISGNSRTVTAITSGQVTSALGYVPISNAGGTFTGDITIAKNNAWFVLDSPSIGTNGEFQAAGISIGESGYKGSASFHITYTGDGSAHIGMGAVDTSTSIMANRAMRLYYLNNNVEFYGTITAPTVAAITLSGSGNGITNLNAGNLTSGTVPQARLSGTYNISISGTASSASVATNATNVSGGSVNATTASFSGAITAAAGSTNGFRFPNDAFGGGGDTARITLETAGGEATRMRFTMTNDADDFFEFFAPNNDGLKFNGNTVIHAGNITSYQPGRDGTGAFGTWPINVSGNAASVSSITSGQVTSALGYTPANGSGPGNINGDQNYQDFLLIRPTIIDYSLFHNALGSRTGSVTINCESGNYVSCTATGAINWSFINPATGSRATGIILELTNGGNFTMSWPSAVRWPAGTAPTLTVSGVDVLVFITDDGGSNWRGAVSMSDSK
jgi:hypothetical protein